MMMMKQQKQKSIEKSKNNQINSSSRKQGVSLTESQKNNNNGYAKKQILPFENWSNIHKIDSKEDLTSKEKVSQNYYDLFKKYHSKESLINKIVNTFDNGDIFNRFNNDYEFCYPDACRDVQQQTKSNISQIERLFRRIPRQTEITINEPLSLDNYSSLLSKILSEEKKDDAIQQQLQPDEPFNQVHGQQKDDMNKVGIKKVNEFNLKDTKIFLLLNQIAWQKKLKEPEMFYYSAMEIKLEELLDYITYNQYSQLNLNEKAKLIVRKLNEFRGKSIDNCSLLALLQIFFTQYKNLQNNKLVELKNIQVKSSQPNHSLKSESRVKSVKEQKNGKDSSDKGSKRSKMSEPTANKKKVQLQSLWITDLS